MSGRKAKSVENNENLCPLSRKRIKSATPSWKQAKPTNSPQSLEEMGIGMLESDESSSSASAIALAVSASDENSNEATPNLDAPKFRHHSMQQNRLNYSVNLDTTDNATFSSELLQTQNYSKASHNINNNVNNNNNNTCSSAERYTDPRNSTEKIHQKKVAILGAGNLNSQKSRSPLATVACNNNYKNINKIQAQASAATPATFVPSTYEITPSSSSTSSSNQIAATASTSAVATKQFFIPDENFFLFRNRGLRGSDGKDHFSTISDEMILLIFKLLPKNTLIRCSYVCQRFNRCARDESLWTRLDLGGRSLRAGALGDILPRGVVILRLAQSELNHPVFDPELLQMYPDFESKLQYLDLSMAVITKPSLKSLFSRCRQLKKLSLEHVQVNDEICDEIAKNVDLEALNLAMVIGLEAWSVRKMMIELKNLNSLNISWTNLNVDAVSALVTNVTPNLMRLNLSGCRKTMFDSPVEDMIIRKYNITQEDFKVMETVVLKSEPHKAGQQWKFTGAFYYATTVLTTIGYGHSTPSTIGGKLFTMCYAIVGIPLGLVMFQSIGERVNRLSSFVIQSVRISLRCKRTAASEVDLICVVTTLSSLTIAGGAAAFSKFEGWSYFDSVYYCFITLTTIGFGDMVALQKDNALNKKPEYVMFALIFILFGLAIVAASLNLLVLRFVTMNTEDERRDEAQAMQALQVAVRLEGDVITANGSILSGYIGHDSQSINAENASICSCHCACFRASRHKKHQYKVRRSPSHIRHLLPEVVPMKDLSFDTHSTNGSALQSRPQSHLLKRNVSLLSFRI